MGPDFDSTTIQGLGFCRFGWVTALEVGLEPGLIAA